ncbi:MAG TPA: TIGR00730 family Rossman fold protein [Solirubrobacterales bacterium]|jgi:hypothetical protein
MVRSRPQRVCVFAGSGDGRRPEYREAASTLGRELAERGIGLVYGGSGRGLMGAAADAALAAGGEAVGVIPEGLRTLEEFHRGLTELHVVGSMHERKAKMGDLADAFVALPGGIGTLEELLEVATWSKLGIHDKPCGVVNTCGYYDALGAMLDAAVAEAFMAPEYRGTVIFAPDPVSLLDRL